MSADPARTGSREDLPSVERLLALSDGVVAIAITLLVLQLHVPSPAKLANPASALLGEYAANPLAVDIFAVNLLAASLATQLTLLYGRRNSLLTAGTTERETRAAHARGRERVRHRFVHRHCLGEYRRRQILLAAACRRAAGRRSLVGPSDHPECRPARWNEMIGQAQWAVSKHPYGPPPGEIHEGSLDTASFMGKAHEL
jgi:Endosomal/lysosomal potassium channel TMEM175